MLPAETIATLRSLEAEFPVDTWVVDGVHAWPLVRLHLGFNLLGQGQDPKRMARSTPRIRALEAFEVAKSLGAKLRDAPGDVRRVPNADVVTLSNPGNRTRVGTAYWDRYFDPIADLLEERALSSLHLEYHDAGVAYRLPRRRPSLLVRPSVSARQAAAALRRVVSRPPELSGYEDFACAAWERAGVRPLAPLRVAERVWAVLYASTYFESLLRRASPCLALCSCYYSIVGLAFCLAARRAGIPCADVQHGVTHLNPAYEGWTRFPAEGYPALPSWFWNWSDADAEPVRAWPEAGLSNHRPVVVGHPWAALFLSNRGPAATYERDVEALKGPSLNVLVALSTSSGLSDVIRRTIDASPKDWTWWIRLHPLMDAERPSISAYFRGRAGPRTIVDAPTDLPLPLLLANADVLMAHNSTVIQEATAFGLPSVAVDRRSNETYAAEVASGWVEVAEGANIVPALRSQSERRARLTRRRSYPSYDELSTAFTRLLTHVA